MCHSDEDRPPAAPGAHSPGHGEDLVLTSSDGNRFSAHIAWPSTPTGISVTLVSGKRERKSDQSERIMAQHHWPIGKDEAGGPDFLWASEL